MKDLGVAEGLGLPPERGELRRSVRQDLMVGLRGIGDPIVAPGDQGVMVCSSVTASGRIRLRGLHGVVPWVGGMLLTWDELDEPGAVELRPQKVKKAPGMELGADWRLALEQRVRLVLGVEMSGSQVLAWGRRGDPVVMVMGPGAIAAAAGRAWTRKNPFA